MKNLYLKSSELRKLRKGVVSIIKRTNRRLGTKTGLNQNPVGKGG